MNNSGTLGSSKIVLSSEDTQSSPTQGASLASQAVAAKKYTVVMYGPSSALAIGMAPIFSRAKQNAVFIQAGSAGIVDGPTIFRLTPTLSTFYPLALKYLQGKGVKSLADIYLNDNPTYTGIDKLLGTDASTYGYAHTGSVSVTTTQTDVSAAVSKLAGMKTDAVAVLMNGAPAATVVGELRQQGYKGTIIAAPNIGAGDVLGRSAMPRTASSGRQTGPPRRRSARPRRSPPRTSRRTERHRTTTRLRPTILSSSSPTRLRTRAVPLSRRDSGDDQSRQLRLHRRSRRQARR